jgi:hypothetical protein
MQMTMSSYTGDNPLYFEDQTFAVSRQDSANWLAGVFSRAGIDNLERQTARLKQHSRETQEETARSDFVVYCPISSYGRTRKGIENGAHSHSPSHPPAVRLLPGCTYISMEVNFNAMATFLWLPRGSHSSGGVA